jgi:hypothetical protein
MGYDDCKEMLQPKKPESGNKAEEMASLTLQRQARLY